MKRLVLAGAGHAHLHVLKALAQRPEKGIEVLLVSAHAHQMHSGMLPGWIAGHYALEECAAKLDPLAVAARATFHRDSVVGVDADRGMLLCAHSGPVGYDVLSVDTGATVDLSWVAATGARLLPIRPLEGFVVGWLSMLEEFRRVGRARVAVVGGGAAGVELALAIRYRLGGELDPAEVQVTLVTGSHLPAGHRNRVAARIQRTLERAGVRIVAGRAAGSERGLALADGSELAAGCIVAAGGACPPSWLAGSGLALSPNGFIAVNASQQSISHQSVFAVGDVASRQDIAHARAGVHAVRAGPMLAGNLQRALDGRPPQPYRPSKHALYLLAAGSKDAVISWKDLSAGGSWVWRWKDWIDRRFLRQYDLVLGGPS